MEFHIIRVETIYTYGFPLIYCAIQYENAGNATTRYAWVALFRPTPVAFKTAKKRA
ncbi:MAG: hypothetical protein QX196_00690 [Methylococcaceae bacterium]